MGAGFHAVRRAIRAAVHPEGTGGAALRRAHERDAREGHARILRWFMCALVPVHLLAVLLFFRLPEPDPGRALWMLWMVRLHVAEGALAVAAAIVAWTGRPVRVWNVLGDLVGTLYLLATAVMSANSQRAHPNLNGFVLGALATAFFLQMRPGVYIAALFAGAGVVLSGIAYFPRDEATRMADTVSLAGVCAIALFGFFVNRALRFRELIARTQVERLNGELGQRVETQVGEMMRRAREIDELNTQLNERIKGRSRELSTALARLADGQEALPPGVVLGGRVEIEAWIGQGGMGAVYRGRDRVTNRTVAVKVVQASSASELDGLHRFLREAQAMASVIHRAIVRPIHVDVSEDGRLFQVMELVEGKTLEACLARTGKLSPGATARLAAVLAEALAAAHAAGVVHRDVKPANVMLTREAPGLKLLDFGISKLWDATGRQTEGRLLGTPEFLAPEQLDAPESVAAPADVHSLGLLAYLCLSGKLPFDTDGGRNQLLARILRDPTEISTWVPDLDPALARTVMACLHKDPAERPRAAALAEKLAEIADRAFVPALEALDLPRLTATPVETPSSPTVNVTSSPMSMREAQRASR